MLKGAEFKYVWFVLIRCHEHSGSSGGYKPRATMATAPGVGPFSLYCSTLFQRGPINLPKWAHGVALGVGPVQLRHCLEVPYSEICHGKKWQFSSSTSVSLAWPFVPVFIFCWNEQMNTIKLFVCNIGNVNGNKWKLWMLRRDIPFELISFYQTARELCLVCTPSILK